MDRTRTNGKANETGTIGASVGTNWADPVHSLAGNMTSVPKPADPANSYGGTYDAWNRLVAVTDGQNTVATYAFDGQGGRIKKTISGDTFDHYYNTSHQLLEVRKNADTDPIEQYVWGQDYIDSAVLRFRDSDSNGTLDETLYVLHDANFNVTAVIDASGDAQERYTYTPYGMRTILDGTWGARGSSSYAWPLGHQGLLIDEETGLIYNRARMLHPGLGRFAQREPMGYVDGMSLYQGLRSNPADLIDPWGDQTHPSTGPATQETPAQREQRLWQTSGYEALIAQYLDFWESWLGLADSNRMPLDADCKSRMRCVLRAMLWVESKHGTVGSNQPGRDPMQVGNTGDPAWPHITNQPSLLPDGQLDPRPVRRGNLPGVSWPNLPGAVAQDPNLPGNVNPNILPPNGRNSSQFTTQHEHILGNALVASEDESGRWRQYTGMELQRLFLGPPNHRSRQLQRRRQSRVQERHS